jgi:predicted tellurium resistance membrane protein TerC
MNKCIFLYQNLYSGFHFGILSGISGITLMRYMAGYFIRCLDKFIHLEDAAYGMILFMGGRMLLDCFAPNWHLPEWVMLIPVFGLLL